MLLSSIITVVGTVIGIFLWIKWLSLDNTKWRYAIAPLSYFVHILLFYITVLYYYVSPQVSPKFLNVWSNGIRLQGVILLIGVAFLLVCRLRGGCPKWMLPK